MSTNITRRDLLRLAGGSILGIFFTPVPWKVLDDSAIWTQNWSLTPKLPRGPVAVRYGTCGLCPAGCGLKVRTVAGIPYSLAGVEAHPISHGTICPAGLGGHHLAYHPLRLPGARTFATKSPDATLSDTTPEEVIREMAGAIAARKQGELVAILDRQPERLISDLYGEFIGLIPGGVLLNSPNSESAMLGMLRGPAEDSGHDLGLNYERADVILAFGAPLLEGWGTPGRMQALLRHDPRPLLFQVESSRTRTSRLADRSFLVHPGSEGALALGIAHIMLRELSDAARLAANAGDFIEYREIVKAYDPARVAMQTGLRTEDIEFLARSLSGRSIVYAAPDPAGGPLNRSSQALIAGLNTLIGSVGSSGGIVPRRRLHPSTGRSTQLSQVPEKSIRLLIIDGAESGYEIPWEILQTRLADEALVVSLSATMSGIAVHADRFIPAPAHMESLQDVATPWDYPVAAFALVPSLLPPHPGCMEARETIFRLGESLGMELSAPRTTADAARKAVERIYGEKRGVVFSPSAGSLPVADVASVDELWQSIESGGVWTDDPLTVKIPPRTLLAGIAPDEILTALKSAEEPSDSLVLEYTGTKMELSAGQSTPLLAKIYQESDLRDAGSVARVHPETAAAAGVRSGERIALRTEAGSRTFTLRTDPLVGRRLIRVSCAPGEAGADPKSESDPRMCASITGEQTWRYTPATLQRKSSET